MSAGGLRFCWRVGYVAGSRCRKIRMVRAHRGRAVPVSPAPGLVAGCWRAQAWLLVRVDTNRRLRRFDALLRLAWTTPCAGQPGASACPARATLRAGRGATAGAAGDAIPTMRPGLVQPRPICSAARPGVMARPRRVCTCGHRRSGTRPRLVRPGPGAVRAAAPFDEAAVALARNTELQPMSPFGWYQLARVHVDRQRPDEAAMKIIRHLKGFEPQGGGPAGAGDRPADCQLETAALMRPIRLAGHSRSRPGDREAEGRNCCRRMELTQQPAAYWRRNLRLSAVLMAIWFVVTFVVSYFARELSFTSSAGRSVSGWVRRVAAGLLRDHLVLRPHMGKLDIEHGVTRKARLTWPNARRPD
jgi:putative solute:sodium symporter small subunit